MLDARRLGYGVLFTAFGALAFSRVPGAGAFHAAILVWLGCSCLFVGVTYLGRCTAWMGKRRDGTQGWLPWLVAGPWLGTVWLAWQLRRLSPESAWHEIDPGLFLGRRCVAREQPPSLDLIVDVTAELPSIGDARRHVVPILDGCAATVGELVTLVDGAQGSNRVFVHCLAGHGRSAMVMAALLLARGRADSPDDAVRKIKTVRRGIHLSPGQRAAIERWHQARSSLGTTKASERLNR